MSRTGRTFTIRLHSRGSAGHELFNVSILSALQQHRRPRHTSTRLRQMMALVGAGESNSPHSPRRGFPNRERKKIKNWVLEFLPDSNSKFGFEEREPNNKIIVSTYIFAQNRYTSPSFPRPFPPLSLFFFQITCRNSPLLYSKACNVRGAAFPFKVPQVSFHKVKERRTGLYSVCIRRSFPNAQSLYISAGVLRNSVDVAKITRIDDVQAHEILTLRPQAWL